MAGRLPILLLTVFVATAIVIVTVGDRGTQWWLEEKEHRGQHDVIFPDTCDIEICENTIKQSFVMIVPANDPSKCPDVLDGHIFSKHVLWKIEHICDAIAKPRVI
jgi:hypothetical protein